MLLITSAALSLPYVVFAVELERRRWRWFG